MLPIEDDPELRLFFFDEAEALAESMLGTVQALIEGAGDETALESLRRGFHTLKGGAAQLPGCDSLLDCSQRAERLAQGMLLNIVITSPALIALLGDVVREAIDLIDVARKTGNMPAYSPILRERMERATLRLQQIERQAMSADNPAPIPCLIDDAV